MSVETILQAIENEIANLTQARNVLASLNGSSSKTPAASNGFAASRAKMAAAQKARWAKYRATKTQSITSKPVRIMSASARRKIAAVQRARWAKLRTGKKAA